MGATSLTLHVPLWLRSIGSLSSEPGRMCCNTLFAYLFSLSDFFFLSSQMPKLSCTYLFTPVLNYISDHNDNNVWGVKESANEARPTRERTLFIILCSFSSSLLFLPLFIYVFRGPVLPSLSVAEIFFCCLCFQNPQQQQQQPNDMWTWEGKKERTRRNHNCAESSVPSLQRGWRGRGGRSGSDLTRGVGCFTLCATFDGKPWVL